MSADFLAPALADQGVDLSPHQLEASRRFLSELERWNRVHNLTAIEGEKASIELHLVDSMAILPVMRAYLPKSGAQIADLGSGGGLPAIPIAIAEPTWTITLIEAVRKKAAFLQHTKGSLKLNNIEVYGDRVERVALLEPGKYDAVISRAFTSLARFLELARPFLKPSGLVFAMKSKRADEEMRAVSTEYWQLLADHLLVIPGLAAERRLLVYAPVRKSPL